MPYSIDHKSRTRERILASALRLFSERGFAQVTIDEVMEAAGLTRGAFYAHFDSKEQLYAEAIHHGIATSAITALAAGPKGIATLRQMVEGYLSLGHVEGTVAPCPLAFFATDVGVREHRVRSTYTSAFRSLAGAMGHHAGARGLDERALAMAVLMVGGVAVSSALTDQALRKRILTGCRQAIMDMVSTDKGQPAVRRQTRRTSRAAGQARASIPR